MLSLYRVPQAPDMAYVTKRHLKLDDDRRRLVDGHATRAGNRAVPSYTLPPFAPSARCGSDANLLDCDSERMVSPRDANLHRVRAG
jgi:hypothetical protein